MNRIRVRQASTKKTNGVHNWIILQDGPTSLRSFTFPSFPMAIHEAHRLARTGFINPLFMRGMQTTALQVWPWL